ncbi:tRNA 2-selenouridine(34) synthase MnmH [Craterilacuibacter sp. RT1T]|uniref:tRNA 2-selenouridine(34) synthase MnmH n=1 Tax=Craterilacuibacter sp. RT1T TaxID=2942211 RepID=UPI0020BE7716|nr:tRNA 2-selenouridine(34) synthase MnmH [Craterilacuibacter sp. RT1T]MCL6262209.1 tRNA 2-selenouridine(34) synthase MnmH [Craterilacuibacter sp. RT1T]
MLFKPATVAQLGQFYEVIDVRSPAEFAEDHIPGAINCPVLDDAQRHEVGTLYKQVSPFEARKVGAALVSRNIALALEEQFADKPRNWRPLIYCWRGGQRSGAMATVFAQVGWPVYQLQGGYKAYRHEVLAQLENLPATLDLRVVCGPTGSGKSRLLDALSHAGHQVLDLEGLANHRGSVLGKLPGSPQPSQKSFDSQLLATMRKLDLARPVFIESESKKVGQVTLPLALFEHMHQSPCLLVDVPLAERVRFLLEDYDFYVSDPESLIKQLGFLKAVHSKEQLAHWSALIRSGEFGLLVGELLTLHYDPLYLRSMDRHYTHLAQAQKIALPSLAPDVLAGVAATLQVA